MTLLRSALFWLALAAFGAVLAQALLPDPGYVLVRVRGHDYETSVAIGTALVLLALFVLTLLWTILRLPFRMFRKHRHQRARSRLIDGLSAWTRGEYARAETVLKQVALQPDAEALARVHAARAAAARGDEATAAAHIDALGERHATMRALAQAERALARNAHAEAMAALDAPAAQPLPPLGLALRAQALAASGRSFEAYGLLGLLRKHQLLPAAELDALQTRWAGEALQQAADGNALAERWDSLPSNLRILPAVATAYARRASALGWQDAATRSIEQALKAHPDHPMLLAMQARLALAQGKAPQAETLLDHALANGGGADAWELLGDAAARSGDEARARQAYANALRVSRGEDVQPLPPRIAGAPAIGPAAIEERDENGLPRLRSS